MADQTYTTQTSNRRPLVVAVAGFLLLIAIGVLFLLPKLHHRHELRETANENTAEMLIEIRTRMFTPDTVVGMQAPSNPCHYIGPGPEKAI